MCFIFGGKEIKDVHSPLINIIKKKDCLTMTLLRHMEKDEMKEKSTEAAMINELDKKEKKKDEAVKVNGLEKKKKEKDMIKEKSTEAAKINELDKKEKKKDEAVKGQ